MLTDERKREIEQIIIDYLWERVDSALGWSMVGYHAVPSTSLDQHLEQLGLTQEELEYAQEIKP